MRHAAKTDACHAIIREGLRAAGYEVEDKHHLPGCLDLWVSSRTKALVLIECKNGPGDKLTPAEQRLFDLFPYNCRRAETPEQAIEIMQEFDEGE